MNNNFNVNNSNTNNQSYNFDPMTGQPIQNFNNASNNKNKNNKIIIIFVAIIIIVVCVFVYTKVIKPSDTQPDNQQTQQNPTNQDNNNNNNTSGTIELGTKVIYDKNGAFLMLVEDVMNLNDKGTVVTGIVIRGTVNVGDTIQVIGLDHEIITTTVIRIEKFRKELDFAEAGDNVGIFLEGVSKDDVERGQVLAQPNSIMAATKFDADIYMLSKPEGGFDTPFFNNYRTQFYIGTIDVPGVIEFPAGVEMINPGENAKITVELDSNIAMEIGTRFSIREGSRTIGTGTITKIY